MRMNIDLTLLTTTRVDIEDYGRHIESLFPVTAVYGECQTDSENTDSCGHSQPQTAAEGSDVSVPSQR